YPDLLIGAYESDAVVLLRSRPIIKIKTSVKGNLTQIDPNSKGCSDDPQSKTACFSVEPCFKILGNSKVSSLQYRIEAETFTGNRLILDTLMIFTQLFGHFTGKKYYRAVFRSPNDPDNP